MLRAFYKMQSPTGRKFTITGTGLTRADAVGEANAKLAVAVGTIIGSGVTDALTVPETGTPHAAEAYDDAVLEARRIFGSGFQYINIALQNVGASYDYFNTGDLDIANPAIAAVATTHRDASGVGGFLAYKGQFVK